MCQCDDFVYTKRSFVCQPHRATGDKCVELKIVGLNLPPDMYGSFLSVSPFACFFFHILSRKTLSNRTWEADQSHCHFLLHPCAENKVWFRLSLIGKCDTHSRAVGLQLILWNKENICNVGCFFFFLFLFSLCSCHHSSFITLLSRETPKSQNIN